jgi:GNAT superfamily N-acetyltransferase
MIISKATSFDLPAIAQIHRKARQQSMPWLPVLHTPEEDYWFFETRVFAEETMWVASVGSEVAGFISFKDDWVNHLYVDPTHWRQNIGTNLLEQAKSSAETLQLWTFQQNQSARSFYTANDFEERELTDGQNNEEKTPDLRMEWRGIR